MLISRFFLIIPVLAIAGSWHVGDAGYRRHLPAHKPLCWPGHWGRTDRRRRSSRWGQSSSSYRPVTRMKPPQPPRQRHRLRLAQALAVRSDDCALGAAPKPASWLREFEARNPVMLVVLVGAVITTLAFPARPRILDIRERLQRSWSPRSSWFTVLLPTLRGHGRRTAELERRHARSVEHWPTGARLRATSNRSLRRGWTSTTWWRFRLAKRSDGEIIEGIASVDESAIAANRHR